MFTPSAFTSFFTFKFPLPVAYGGGEIVLPLRIQTNRDATEASLAFLTLSDAERTDARFSEFIRRSVCALLTAEPTGVAEFPTDDRPLSERAYEYFTAKEDHPFRGELQEFYDGVMIAAFAAHREVSLPATFFRSVQDNEPRGAGDGEPDA